MRIQRAAVVGAGAMGSGIAQVLSQTGIEVILKDVDESYVDKGLANIKRMYESRLRKEVLTQSESEYLFAMIKGTTTYDEFSDVDLVIEAALEQIDVKTEIFRQLDSICPKRTILATNTSALSISEIASCTTRPEKVLGMHFFNPAQTMKLVEVIPGVRTAFDTVKEAMELCRNLNKVPVEVKECPGFLVNRLLFPYLNEALYVLEEGSYSPHEVDQAVVEFGLPMGPFALLDMTGIDICAHVNEFLYAEYGPRFKPASLLKDLVKASHLGQKTGKGLYVHPKEQVHGKKGEYKQLNPDLSKWINTQKSASNSKQKFDAYRVILPMFNEAVYAMQEQVVEPADVDVAMEWGCGLTRGLLTLAQEKGLDWCLKQLQEYHGSLGERFRPSWLLKKLVRAKARDFGSLSPQPVTVR